MGFPMQRPRLPSPPVGHTNYGKGLGCIGKTSGHRSGPHKQGQLLSPCHRRNHIPLPFLSLFCSPVPATCHSSPFSGAQTCPQHPPLHWLCARDFPVDSPARPSLQSSGMASTNLLEPLDLQSPQAPRNQHNPHGTHHLSKANLSRSPLAMNRLLFP